MMYLHCVYNINSKVHCEGGVSKVGSVTRNIVKGLLLNLLLLL